MTGSEDALPPWEWVTLTEAARLVVACGYAPHMTRQRLARLSETDPAWPVPKEQVRVVGQARLVPWPVVEAYFRQRDARPGPKGWGVERQPAIAVDPVVPPGRP
ncbi:MAG TPA: hypothetical protein VGX23_19035 [Actinocrinis sp.]|jgi:hypothetical protein|nr:hypothetical protein [Actinocrinis sp.]